LLILFAVGLATMHSVTDRLTDGQTDDSIVGIVDLILHIQYE